MDKEKGSKSEAKIRREVGQVLNMTVDLVAARNVVQTSMHFIHELEYFQRTVWEATAGREPKPLGRRRRKKVMASVKKALTPQSSPSIHRSREMDLPATGRLSTNAPLGLEAFPLVRESEVIFSPRKAHTASEVMGGGRRHTKNPRRHNMDSSIGRSISEKNQELGPQETIFAPPSGDASPGDHRTRQLLYSILRAQARKANASPSTVASSYPPDMRHIWAISHANRRPYLLRTRSENPAFSLPSIDSNPSLSPSHHPVFRLDASSCISDLEDNLSIASCDSLASFWPTEGSQPCLSKEGLESNSATEIAIAGLNIGPDTGSTVGQVVMQPVPPPAQPVRPRTVGRVERQNPLKEGKKRKAKIKRKKSVFHRLHEKANAASKDKMSAQDPPNSQTKYKFKQPTVMESFFRLFPQSPHFPDKLSSGGSGGPLDKPDRFILKRLKQINALQMATIRWEAMPRKDQRRMDKEDGHQSENSRSRKKGINGYRLHSATSIPRNASRYTVSGPDSLDEGTTNELDARSKAKSDKRSFLNLKKKHQIAYKKYGEVQQIRFRRPSAESSPKFKVKS